MLSLIIINFMSAEENNDLAYVFGRSIFQGLSVIGMAFFVTFESVLLGMCVHAVEFFKSYFGVKKC